MLVILQDFVLLMVLVLLPCTSPFKRGVLLQHHHLKQNGVYFRQKMANGKQIDDAEITQSRYFLPLPASIDYSMACKTCSGQLKPTTTIRVLQFNILGDGLSALQDHLGKT